MNVQCIDIPNHPRFMDLKGQHFGRWKVTAYAGKDEHRKHRWVCLCDCGGIGIVSTNSLRKKHSTSCGCYKREYTRANTTHNDSSSDVYSIWVGMKGRCYNKKTEAYEFYGARGIRVDAVWKNDYVRFKEDMGSRPSSLHSIDRINNDGNYSPGNCRWATFATQASNRRNVVLIEFEGESYTIRSLADKQGMIYDTIKSRRLNGWSDEELIRGYR